MTNQELLSRIDHTALKPVTTWTDVEKLCGEAIFYKTASVCIPASYIQRARSNFPPLNLCTVIGFPLGYSTTASKLAEAKEALEMGADELDMVINLGDVKNGDFDKTRGEIDAMRSLCNNKILKVIIETCFLTTEEKIELCKIVTKCRADFIKTSTGFGSGGAMHEDIELLKTNIGGSIKIKASGGIKTREDMESYIKQGCSRLGTSSAQILF